ncbi:hypothetical protein [uncultured Psychroserpens sp.]|uniref:hypothetical protein n=1 Tax=uncultured Psychroserpens sp. TaxID=255436 RepID=UPI002636EF8F|nr:hypothetical protein [uncultured Psychroserpens sp.]
MKELFHYHSRYFLVLLLCAFALNFTSCEKESNPENISSEELRLRIDKVVSKMKVLGDENSKIVTYEFANLKKDDYLGFIEIIENSAKVMDFVNGTENLNRGPGDDYQVTCTYGDGESVVTECGEDVGCAGQATWDCLEGGGCANVCNNKAKITYTPNNIN